MGKGLSTDDGIALLDTPLGPLTLVSHRLPTARFQGRIAQVGTAHLRLVRLAIVEELGETVEPTGGAISSAEIRAVFEYARKAGKTVDLA